MADEYAFPRKRMTRAMFPTEASWQEYKRLAKAAYPGAETGTDIYKTRLAARSQALYGSGGPLQFGSQEITQELGGVKPRSGVWFRKLTQKVSNAYAKIPMKKAMLVVGLLGALSATTTRKPIEEAVGTPGLEAYVPHKALQATAMWGGGEERMQAASMWMYQAAKFRDTGEADKAISHMRTVIQGTRDMVKAFGAEKDIMGKMNLAYAETAEGYTDFKTIENRALREKESSLKAIKPLQKFVTDELWNENEAMRLNRRELKHTEEALAEAQRKAGLMMGARFQTGGTVGGAGVGTELGGMKQVSELGYAAMQAKRDYLAGPDQYADYKQMAKDERLLSKERRVAVAQLNLEYVAAAKGTSEKDRRMVALQQLRAEEQLRAAQANLSIENEHREAEALDTAKRKWDELSKQYQIAQLDFDITYSQMHEQIKFFVMAHEDAANKEDGIPGSLSAIKSELTLTWAKQVDLNDAISGLKTSIEGNEDNITTFKHELTTLADDGIGYLNSAVLNVINNTRIMKEELEDAGISFGGGGYTYSKYDGGNGNEELKISPIE